MILCSWVHGLQLQATTEPVLLDSFLILSPQVLVIRSTMDNWNKSKQLARAHRQHKLAKVKNLVEKKNEHQQIQVHL